MPKSHLKGKSLPEFFFHLVEKNPSHKMFATRIDGEWVSTSAAESLDYCLQSVAGLQHLGFSSNDKICIFSENRKEWILTDYAAQWMGGATTAVYATSSPEDIEHILKSSGARFLFVGDEEMFQRLYELQSLGSVEFIICWESYSLSGAHLNAKIISASEFLKPAVSRSKALELLEQIDPESMTILLYTSGTTGEPKGVVLTQKNVTTNMRQLLGSMPIHQMKRTMSFLPLSHIYERVLHSMMLFAEVQIYFAQSIAKLVENMAEAKPTIMIGVPRIFEKMYLKIQEKLRTAPTWRKLIAKFAFKIGDMTVGFRIKARPIPFPLSFLQKIADLLVFNKIRAITGGELVYFVSGGAPLSEEIARFFFQTGITILEGFGMSETMILGYNRPGRIKFGTVGEPVEDTEYKIADDGEILVRGPQVMSSYYESPEKTAEVFTDDGWFRTGDIGELDSEGFLKITDRKKEIIITAGGKNVAPQPIENRIKENPLVEQVCLVGDKRKYLTVLLVPNLELCESWAKHKGIKIENRQQCAESQAFKDHIQDFISKLNEDLARYETIKYFEILPEPFSIDGGELTPTLKLKRRIIQEKYSDLIDKMYPQDERHVASS